MNDALVARPGRSREFAYSAQPAHVIAPPRLCPEPGQGLGRMPFGPVETLPPVYCEGCFRSGPGFWRPTAYVGWQGGIRRWRTR